MVRQSTHRASLSRTIRQLATKHATLIIGCLLCAGSACALLAQANEPAIELARIDAAAQQEGEADPGSGEAGDVSEEEGTAESGEKDDATPAHARIHIDGEVVAPGVYEIAGDDLRVMDVVEVAGGLGANADVSQVNLAAQVHDADKVHIPAVGEVSQAGGSGVASGGTAISASGASDPSTPININQASAEELCALPGVGEATAKKIVADRESSGPFASPEDLMRVSGIGEKKFESLKDLICV